MEENENRQDGNVYSDGATSVDGQLENLQQQGNGQQQQAEPVYARIEQYSNLYGGSANQTVNYGKVKPAKVKKKHPVFKRMVLSIVSGIVFGLFAGLGVYDDRSSGTEPPVASMLTQANQSSQSVLHKL